MIHGYTFKTWCVHARWPIWRYLSCSLTNHSGCLRHHSVASMYHPPVHKDGLPPIGLLLEKNPLIPRKFAQSRDQPAA
jgi:hypothetical protein